MVNEYAAELIPLAETTSGYVPASMPGGNVISVVTRLVPVIRLQVLQLKVRA